MFTLEEIKSAHSKVKSGSDFPAYIQDLIRLGVKGYDTYVFDGHAEYFGGSGFDLSSPAKYELLNVESDSNKERFLADLKSHQQGKTDYPTFCRDCAVSGVEKWTVDLDAMTCTYLDRKGNLILVENIPVPGKE